MTTAKATLTGCFFMRFGVIFLVGKFAYIITFSYICSVKKSINQPLKERKKYEVI